MGDEVVGADDGESVGAEVGIAEGALVGVADVGDDVFTVVLGVEVGRVIGLLIGFDDEVEVGASVVTDTDAVVFHVTPVAFKSLMLVSAGSFANVPFLSAANAFAVSFCSTLTNSPS